VDNTSKVAVCSRSFSQHPTLRAELLAAFSNVKFNDEGLSLEGAKLVEFLKGSDKAVIALEKVDADLLSAVPELKVIGKYGVGLDKIDFQAMDKAGVKLGWTAGVNAQAVAELTLGMALSLVRNMPESQELVKNHGWKQIKGKQLSSMTYGILGCGYVGKSLVKLLRPFGCRIISHDIADQSSFYKEYGVENVDFETLISTATILSIHIPRTDKTKNIINKSVLSRMKKGSILINTARGGLIDEVALLEMLNSSHLTAAGLDVFDIEPPVEFSLIDHPRVIATTHIGGSSEEAILAMGRAAIHGLNHFQMAGNYEQ
jgi:phosphoglycerate dehydrogenase-like enzyme